MCIGHSTFIHEQAFYGLVYITLSLYLILNIVCNLSPPPPILLYICCFMLALGWHMKKRKEKKNKHSVGKCNWIWWTVSAIHCHERQHHYRIVQDFYLYFIKLLNITERFIFKIDSLYLYSISGILRTNFSCFHVSPR